MALILCIETASKTCSVALAKDGQLLGLEETAEVYSHAGKVTLFAEKVIKENGYTFQNLDAVAVSMGPGSYTGLRIGLSTAKGYCYALSIPLIGISTLESMAFGMKEKVKDTATWLMPAIDARRDEAYVAIFNNKLQTKMEPQPVIFEANSLIEFQGRKMYVAGTGAEKIERIVDCKEWVCNNENVCSARNLVSLSETYFELKKFENVAYTEPSYLKAFHSTKKKI